GRDGAPYEIYADIDATKSFDYPLAGGPPPPPPPAAACTATGGGTIAAGGKFSLDAHANLHGKVQYREVADFRSTRLISVTCDAATHSATINGEGTNNGHMVTFTVKVVDNGESGSSDVFTITLSDGYSKSGT